MSPKDVYHSQLLYVVPRTHIPTLEYTTTTPCSVMDPLGVPLNTTLIPKKDLRTCITLV